MSEWNPSETPRLKLTTESADVHIHTYTFGWDEAYLPRLAADGLGSKLKRRLMDILACPIDKHYPLELYVFEEKEEIAEGLLVCSKCGRWYPIIDEIPQLLPDDLREAKMELLWLEKWRQQVPQKVLSQGKPFTLH